MLSEALDLSFKPVSNPAPKKLNPAQIAAFNEKGFVQPFDIFTSEEIAAHRAYFDRLIADMGEQGSYGINCYQGRLRGLWDLCTEPRLLDHVEDLIGPNIICWASAILSKKPHDPKAVPWHQDASFWQLTPARTVTVWLAIDDADPANSAMQFIPGSHKNGALEIRKSGKDSVFHIETAGAEAMGDPFTNSLRAGHISLHADMLVHGSQPNRSDRRRCGLTIRYCPPEVSIIDEEWAQGVEAIICRGTDPTGRWRHHPRPASDAITEIDSPRNYGTN